MKLIKKIFPNYKSKRELRNEIALLNSVSKQKFVVKKINYKEYSAQIIVSKRYTIPDKYVKQELMQKLSEQIAEHITIVKMKDYLENTIYKGTIYVVEDENEFEENRFYRKQVEE